MLHVRLLAASLAVTAFLSPVAAQRVTGGPDPERKTSTVVVSADSGEMLAAVSIGYGPAKWHPGYDDMLPQLRGSHYARLGIGWRTTLDTAKAVEIAGTTLAAGSYYLGFAVAADGGVSLLVFDSKRAMQAGLLPATTALYTGAVEPEARVALVPAREPRKDVVGKLEIEITGDEQAPTTGRLALRWGEHELTAPMKFHVATPKAPAPK
jgi:hypothetical protein